MSIDDWRVLHVGHEWFYLGVRDAYKLEGSTPILWSGQLGIGVYQIEEKLPEPSLIQRIKVEGKENQKTSHNGQHPKKKLWTENSRWEVFWTKRLSDDLLLHNCERALCCS
jgi:hypothetical protein